MVARRGRADRGERSRDRSEDRGSSRRGSSRRGESKRRYNTTSADEYRRRSHQRGGGGESFIKEDVKVFTPKENLNVFRICPSTWEGAKSYGYDVWVHYGIGPNNAQVVCPAQMKSGACPICEERARAEKEGDSEYADELKPNKRVLTFIVDRDNEKQGPQLFPMSWTTDRDIGKHAYDERTGEVLSVDDPYEGFDIELDREGKDKRTRYTVKIARNSNSLARDEDKLDDWLGFIEDHPVPDMIIHRSYEEIEELFSGAKAHDKDEEEEDNHGRRGSSRRRVDRDEEDEGDEPSRSSRSSTRKKKSKEEEEDDLPTWDDVHEMEFEELEELVEEKDGDVSDLDQFSDDDLEEAQDYVCELLEIEAPRKKTSRGGRGGSRRKTRR